MNSSEIEKRQNEDRMLRYQYASRRYFNRAEKLNDLVWVMCINSWLVIFLPDIPNTEILVIVISAFADTVAVIFSGIMANYIASASSLRRYFDAYVLGINIEQFDAPQVQKLEELSLKAINDSPDIAKVEMANTGHDKPNGVRNWYEFTRPLSEEDAVYECQKLNGWWNKKMSGERIKYTVIRLIIFISLAILLLIITKADILITILSSIALIIKCIERLVANLRYYKISLEIDGAIDVLTSNRSSENVKEVQAKIDERRAMPVLERNRIHKRRSKEYHQLYHDTNI